jgi:hypothetical protein
MISSQKTFGVALLVAASSVCAGAQTQSTSQKSTPKSPPVNTSCYPRINKPTHMSRSNATTQELRLIRSVARPDLEPN